MIEQFINCYSLSKTLRFSLIPVGKTEEYFNHYVLETDLQRSENYKSIKTVIDRYHKEFIESVLKNFVLEGVEEYATSYYKHEELINKEKKMRDAIKKRLKAINGTNYLVQGKVIL